MLQLTAISSQLNVNESNIRLSQVLDHGKFFDKYRVQSLLIERIYREQQEFFKLAVRISNCSNFLRFSLNSSNNFVLKEANFCHVRYCCVCSWRKSLCRRIMLYRAYEKIELQNCNYNFIFLTLTVKNCRVENLRETLDLMRNAWHKLIKREQFINVVEGYIRSTEITRDSKCVNTYAHPHFHIILLVKSSYYKENYIRQEDWVKMWRECLRVDYDPVLDIRSVKAKGTSSSAVKSAIIETLKYSVKYSDINIDVNSLKSRKWFYILTRETRKLRFFATGGIFKDAIKDDSEISNEDLVKLSNNYERLNDEELFNFVFCRSKKYYEYKSNF